MARGGCLGCTGARVGTTAGGAMREIGGDAAIVDSSKGGEKNDRLLQTCAQGGQNGLGGMLGTHGDELVMLGLAIHADLESQ